tara:strand:+ start:2145 stop:2993 length:849 start_codon:yes stop_codon:yes gene_type:complete
MTRIPHELQQLRYHLNDPVSEMLFVHSGVTKVRNYVTEPLNTKKPDAFLSAHVKLLQSLADERVLVFPTFNYQFFKSGTFDVNHSASEIGLLSEYARQHYAKWRSFDPVFTFSGQKLCADTWLIPREIVRPFGLGSSFDMLVQQKAQILFYGCDLASGTLIHQAEALINIPYRYQKTFRGSYRSHDKVFDIQFTSHFWPWGTSLSYDWDQLKLDLINARLLHVIKNSCSVIRADLYIEFLLEKLQADPLSLLSQKSRIWVEDKLQALGRPFQQSDFEILTMA